MSGCYFSEAQSKACCEKSEEAIDTDTSLREIKSRRSHEISKG